MAEAKNREWKRTLNRLFAAALRAADPAQALAHIPRPEVAGRLVVVGAGKAAAAMARGLERAWGQPLAGLVVTPYGHGVSCRGVRVIEAAHPVPDQAGRHAAAEILALATGLGADDLLVVLLSGGGSALLALPAPGLELDDKRALSAALLKSGATIAEMNAIRKHLSAIKGGRLAAAAYPARTLTFAISDVPGDRADVIASGPSVGDPSTLANVRAILKRFEIRPSPAIAAYLADPANETLKPGDPRLSRAEFRLVVCPQDALEAAATEARALGLTPLILGDAIEGEAREVATVMAGIARACAAHGTPVKPPAVLLSGGETTVRVTGHGQGGRNAEFILALATALAGHPAITALAADSDGIDGTSDAAGGVIGPDILTALARAGIDPRAALADNDAYSALKAADALVVTGPTLTNVNDFRAILIA